MNKYDGVSRPWRSGPVGCGAGREAPRAGWPARWSQSIGRGRPLRLRTREARQLCSFLSLPMAGILESPRETAALWAVVVSSSRSICSGVSLRYQYLKLRNTMASAFLTRAGHYFCLISVRAKYTQLHGMKMTTNAICTVFLGASWGPS